MADSPHNDEAALADALQADMAASFDALFEDVELDQALMEDVADEEEPEWLSNKDAFPTLDTMATWVGEEPSRITVGPKTKPVQRRQQVVRSLSPMLPAMEVAEVAEDKGSTMVMCLMEAHPHVTMGSRTKGVQRRRQEVSWNLPPMLHAVEQAGLMQNAHSQQQCRHCDVEDTPQWRAGPEGPRTLCNACGIRYRTGRLVPEYRPANSPKFSPEMYSNSHRRVIEMRRLKDSDAAEPTAATSSRFPHAEMGRE